MSLSLDLNSPFLLLFIGLLYIIVMGALSLLRREGLSIRFAVESLLLIALIGGLAFVTGYVMHPVLFLVVIYLVTMRVRLMVDLGNSFASRGRFDAAQRLYHFAQWLGPDPVSQVNIAINQGVLRLQRRELDEAIGMFREVLTNRAKSSL